jgi:hypothetical protein
MMTGQPSRVTPAEIVDLVASALAMDRQATLDEQIAYHERKARLLSRVAADLDTAEAHLVAAEAWQYASQLARTRGHQGSEVAP